MRMPELKALTREHRLRGYSQLRKAELIAFLQDNAPQEAHVHVWRLQDNRDPQGPQGALSPPLCRDLLHHLHKCLLLNL